MSSPTAENRPFRKRQLVYLAIAVLALAGVGTWYGCDRVYPVAHFTSHWSAVTVAFTSDGRRLVVGLMGRDSGDMGLGKVCLLDAATGKELAAASLPDPVRCLAICPDDSGVWVGCGSVTQDISGERRIRVGRGALTLLDLKSLAKRASLKESRTVTGVAISPDGKTVAALISGPSAKGLALTLWNTETKQHEKPIGLEGHTYTDDQLPLQKKLAFSPDGKLLAVALGREYGYPCEVVVWDVQKNEKAGSVRVSGGPPTCVSFSPDGEQLAIASTGGLIRAETSGAFAAHHETCGGVAGIEWIPRQPECVVASWPSRKAKPTLLDLTNKRSPIRFVTPDPYSIRALAVSSDGKLLAAGDSNGSVYIWRIPKRWRLW